MFKDPYMWATLSSIALALFSMHFKNNYKQTLKKQQKRTAGLFAFLSFIPLTFLASVRYGIGDDFFSYFEIFNSYAESLKATEPGFWFLVGFIHRFTDNPQIFMAIAAVITYGCFYWIIYRESENPAYSILLFVLTRDYFCSLDETRQYIAMAIAFLAIPAMRRSGFDWILAVFLAAVGFTIHNSVMAVLALYLLFAINPPIWLSGFLVLVCYAMPVSIFNFLCKYIEPLNLYSHYIFNSPAFEASTFLSFFCLFAFCALFIYRKESKKTIQTRFFMNSTLFGMSSVAAGATTSWVLTRIAYYSNPFVFLYLPHILNQIKKKWLKVVAYIFITAGFFAVCNFVTLAGNQGVLGYKTFWQV